MNMLMFYEYMFNTKYRHDIKQYICKQSSLPTSEFLHKIMGFLKKKARSFLSLFFFKQDIIGNNSGRPSHAYVTSPLRKYLRCHLQDANKDTLKCPTSPRGRGTQGLTHPVQACAGPATPVPFPSLVLLRL